MLIGYARISTTGQDPAHQLDALARAGVAEEDVHLDVASGAKASRPALDLALARLRGGDTLVVTRLDRLGRSVLHLVTLGAVLRDRGVGLRVLEQGIDTSTAEGRAMFGMLSVLAELQRELIAANTRDGLAAARVRHALIEGDLDLAWPAPAGCGLALAEANLAAMWGTYRSGGYSRLVYAAPAWVRRVGTDGRSVVEIAGEWRAALGWSTLDEDAQELILLR